MLVIALAVVLGLAVAADYAARAWAENLIATRLQEHGFTHKPHVTVEGFPFLTQLVSRDLGQVRITATEVPAGPVDLSAVDAELHHVRLTSGFSGAVVDKLTGTARIGFSSLASAVVAQVGPLAAALGGVARLRLSDGGPGEIRASMNLFGATASAVWRVSMLSGSELNLRLASSGSVPASVLEPLRDVTIKLPALPYGITISSVTVTPDGVVGELGGRHIHLGG